MLGGGRYDSCRRWWDAREEKNIDEPVGDGTDKISTVFNRPDLRSSTLHHFVQRPFWCRSRAKLEVLEEWIRSMIHYLRQIHPEDASCQHYYEFPAKGDMQSLLVHPDLRSTLGIMDNCKTIASSFPSRNKTLPLGNTVCTPVLETVPTSMPNLGKALYAGHGL